MIKESKFKNKSRKIIKGYKNKNKNKYLRHKKTVKNAGIINLKIQKGGEVKALSDFDYNQLNLSKYINANVDWGTCPGAPPMDCCIL